MAKIRRKLLVALSMVLAFACCMFCLTACGTKTYEVKFMVKNAEGIYQQYGAETVKTNEDGSVTLPKAPTEEFMEFRGWYLEESCETQFDDKKVTKDTTVYAKFVDRIVNLKIRDEAGNWATQNEVQLRNIESIKSEKQADAKSKNLEFQAWYINEDCTAEYSTASNASTIHGRYMARVNFDNGYEVVKTELLIPGTTVENPGQTDFDKHYMDSEDIFYVSAEDKVTPYNFAEKINTNTTIRVLWKTPNLEFKPIGENYRFSDFSVRAEDRAALATYPVVSIPNKVTIDGKLVSVVGMNGDNVRQAKVATKIIINEGIEYVNVLNGDHSGSTIEEIELPSTLKVIERSFMNYNNLKSLELPEGLEVIIDCFWQDVKYGTAKDKGFDFDVKIPSTVTNMAEVPANLVYAEGSPFMNDGNRVYKNDPDGLGKILITEVQANVVDGNLSIPDGVTAIQVGILSDIDYDYLELPESFVAVSYNNEKTDYPSYFGTRLTLTDKVGLDSDPTAYATEMSSKGYAIVDDVESHEYIKFVTSQYPATINPYAFSGIVSSGNSGTREDYSAFPMQVVFVAEVAPTTPVTVYAKTLNTVNGESQEFIFDTFRSGDTITQQQLVDLMDLGLFKIDAVKEFGQLYFAENEDKEGKVIKANQYIVMEYSAVFTGFTSELSEDGKSRIVTGFDKETSAHLDPANPESPYLVNIVAEVEGVPVTEIKAEAFMNDTMVGKVYVASSVKKIGDRAFKGAYNIQEINIKAGGLEEIGTEAFQYIGAKKLDNNPVPEVNPSLPKYGYGSNDNAPTTWIKFPVGNLKNVGPNAFDSPAIREFEYVKEEAGRTTFSAGNVFFSGANETNTNLVEGQFYLNNDVEGTHLVKYTGKETRTINGKEMPVVNYDHVAVAPGYLRQEEVMLGGVHTNFQFNDITASYNAHVLEGSISIYPNGKYGYFNLVISAVSKIEKNAVTYIPANFMDENVKDPQICLIRNGGTTTFTVEQFKAQDPTIFTPGWIKGVEITPDSFWVKNITDDNATPAV